jgi:hypothetical protein
MATQNSLTVGMQDGRITARFIRRKGPRVWQVVALASTLAWFVFHILDAAIVTAIYA